jgi:hypothetical protein
MYFHYSEGKIDANKISFRGQTSSNLYGIICRYISTYTKSISSIVSNNEIMISVAGPDVTGRGITVDYSDISVVNNSILIEGTVAESHGIEIYGAGSSYNYVVENNNIVTLSQKAYPIYLGDNSYGNPWVINSNNYYANQFIGVRNNTAYSSLASWKAALPGDNLSVRYEPVFIDTTTGLDLVETGDLICMRNSDVLTDITGSPRKAYTTMGAYSKYIMERDLELVEIVSPSHYADLCSPSYLPIRYLIANNGTTDCNFTKDSLKLHFSMTGTIDFDTVVTINTGLLRRFTSNTFELYDLLDVSFAGDYDIEAWISTDSFDIVHTNDTLRMTYRNNKIALPFEIDFSTPDLSNFTIQSVLGDSIWKVEPDTIPNYIQPYYGNGMLILDGSVGTISRISTGQLELNRTQQPIIEFWYAHTNTDPESEDQLDVRLTYDGGTNYITLLNIMRYDSAATVPTWEKYMIDLSAYQDSSCVVISFDGYSYGGTQCIDRIFISASQDVAISNTVIDPYFACDLDGKHFGVILTNETGKNIDFDLPDNQTDLIIELTHENNLISRDTFSLTGLFIGLTADTVMANQAINLDKGVYIITSWLTQSIDNNDTNDIYRDTIIIDPKFSIEISKISAPNACLAGQLQIKQEVKIINTGNLDLSDIELTLQIDTGEAGSPIYIILKDTCTGIILTGDTTTYTFTDMYTAPWNNNYYVRTTGALLCNFDLVNSTNEIMECVDMKDLYIVSIDNPSSGTDHAGSLVQVTVTLNNRSDYKEFTNANITVSITNSQGIETTSFTEKKTISILATASHTFTNSYTVPSDTVYYVTVYTDSYDNYSYNDTMTIKRLTDYVSINSIKEKDVFTLNQNIPNPADNTTRIDYSIPETGEVIFYIHSVSGQLLYSKTIEAECGNNSIVLSTSMLSAGVYFYSMEYKGQHLVRRMSIRQ